MRVRSKDTKQEFASSKFNTTTTGEVIGYGDSFGSDSFYIKNLDVLIGDVWKDMLQAFEDHDLIVDNYNTTFFEPPTEEARKRGHTL